MPSAIESSNKLTISRRRLLGALAASLGYVCLGRQTAAVTIAPYYLHVRMIFLYARFRFNGHQRREYCDESMLEEITAYIKESIKEYHPEINVVYKPCDTSAWPEGAREPTTLRVFVQISTNEVKRPDHPFDGYLGAIGVRLHIREHYTGMESVPVEPFTATGDGDELRSRTYEAFRRQMDNAIVLPFTPRSEN